MDKRIAKVVLSVAVPAFAVGTDFIGGIMLVTPIENEFGADFTTTQWVLNIYALTFAMTLVSGGRLADMFGRRKLLLIGLVAFMVSSLGCMYAPTVAWLIVARAVQGIAAGIMWPCVIAIPAAGVAVEKQGTTLGLVMGCVTLGNVIGPLIAGVLGSFGDWRWFFGLNVVLGGIAIVLALMLVPVHIAERKRERIDFAGMIVLSIGILALLYAMDVGGDWGWASWWVLGLLALAAVLFVLFPLIEKCVAQPMVPPDLLRNGQFMIAIAANGLVVPSFFVAFLYAPQFLNKVLGWSYFSAMIGVLPLMVALATTAVLGGRLYDLLGARVLLIGGYTLAAVSSLTAWLVAGDWGYPSLVALMVLAGVGGGICVPPASTAAVAATESKNAGLAGGLSFMSHLGMGAIGVACATAVLATASSRHFSRGLETIGITISDTDQHALNGGSPKSEATTQILSHYSSEEASKIVTAMQESFTYGFHRAFLVPLIFTMIGLVLVLFLKKQEMKTGKQ